MPVLMTNNAFYRGKLYWGNLKQGAIVDSRRISVEIPASALVIFVFEMGLGSVVG